MLLLNYEFLYILLLFIMSLFIYFFSSFLSLILDFLPFEEGFLKRRLTSSTVARCFLGRGKSLDTLCLRVIRGWIKNLGCSEVLQSARDVS